MNRPAMLTRLTINYGGHTIHPIDFDIGPLDQLDIPSTVAVTSHLDEHDGLPSDDLWDYSDEDLAKICLFADEHDAFYDAHWTERRGCNPIIFDKSTLPVPKPWLVKRGSWISGYPFHETLDAALAWMRSHT